MLGLPIFGFFTRLQIAPAHAKDVHSHSNSMRFLSYASEGIPPLTQEDGWDLDDIEQADREAEEEDE